VTILKKLGSAFKNSKEKDNDELSRLSKELQDLKRRSARLYESVEKGLVPMDTTLHERGHRNQAKRQEILLEIAGLRKKREFPIAKMGKKYVQAFCSVLAEKLKDRESNFGK
jgi:site-specific DNA recombinase